MIFTVCSNSSSRRLHDELLQLLEFMVVEFAKMNAGVVFCSARGGVSGKG